MDLKWILKKAIWYTLLMSVVFIWGYNVGSVEYRPRMCANYNDYLLTERKRSDIIEE